MSNINITKLVEEYLEAKARWNLFLDSLKSELIRNCSDSVSSFEKNDVTSTFSFYLLGHKISTVLSTYAKNFHIHYRISLSNGDEIQGTFRHEGAFRFESQKSHISIYLVDRSESTWSRNENANVLIKILINEILNHKFEEA